MVIRLLIAIMNQIYCASEEAFALANRQSTAALHRQNLDSSTHLACLIALLHLPDWWLAGGAVRNTVWRSHLSIDFRASDSSYGGFGTTVVRGMKLE